MLENSKTRKCTHSYHPHLQNTIDIRQASPMVALWPFTLEEWCEPDLVAEARGRDEVDGLVSASQTPA